MQRNGVFPCFCWIPRCQMTTPRHQAAGALELTLRNACDLWLSQVVTMTEQHLWCEEECTNMFWPFRLSYLQRGLSLSSTRRFGSPQMLGAVDQKKMLPQKWQAWNLGRAGRGLTDRKWLGVTQATYDKHLPKLLQGVRNDNYCNNSVECWGAVHNLQCLCQCSLNPWLASCTWTTQPNCQCFPKIEKPNEEKRELSCVLSSSYLVSTSYLSLLATFLATTSSLFDRPPGL